MRQTPAKRIAVPVQLRWSDLDAYGHVNNVAFLTLLEEARIAAFWRSGPGTATPGMPSAVLDAGPGALTATLVARQEVEYLAAIEFPSSSVVVELWIGKLGGASIEVCYEVIVEGTGTTLGPVVCARAATTLVLVDSASGRPRRITDAERAVWSSHLDTPVAFRHAR